MPKHNIRFHIQTEYTNILAVLENILVFKGLISNLIEKEALCFHERKKTAHIKPEVYFINNLLFQYPH